MTTDWTAGYTAEVAYTYGYYPELNPQRMRMALLHAGLAAPTVNAACELGFGQGITINLHAAGAAAHWVGTDFNPAQASFAQQLAGLSGSGADLFDDAFEDFARRDDLPMLDFIAMHGIWSWISNENRQIIVDLIARRLRPGGVLYISYNTLPGWASFAPMRHLLAQHAEVLGTQGQGILGRVDASLAFASELMAAEPLYAKANPQVAERLKGLGNQSRSYLAHEYFNQHWQPMYFSDMQRWLGAAKLQYGCSANFYDHLDALNLTPAHQALLASCTDAGWREQVRDYLTNQQFRRDYWVKGARNLSAIEQTEQLRQTRVVLLVQPQGLEMKFKGRLGEAKPQGGLYAALLEALAASPAALTLGELEKQLARHPGATFAKLREMVMAMLGAGYIGLAQDEGAAQAAHASCARLNAHLASLSRATADLNYLASPVTGGGVIVQRFPQMFLTALAQGATDAASVATHVWQVLKSQGQKLQVQGRALQSEADNVATLQAQAQDFLTKQWPLLQRLGVVLSAQEGA